MEATEQEGTGVHAEGFPREAWDADACPQHAQPTKIRISLEVDLRPKKMEAGDSLRGPTGDNATLVPLSGC